MIIQFLFTILISIAQALTGFLPTVETLPWGIDALLVTSTGYFKGFMQIFPPLQIVFGAFMLYLGFRLLLIVLKIFMGKRTPHHD